MSPAVGSLEDAQAVGRMGSAEYATDLMTYLAADDPVFPGSPRRDRAHARRAAVRVVELLGNRSVRHTNISDLSEQVRAWSAVTRHTFDSVVAGTGNGFTVVLLQVGEDRPPHCGFDPGLDTARQNHFGLAVA